MVVPLRDGPRLEILLVLGLAVERCFRFVVLALGFTARFGSHFPVLKVLAHHRAAHALLGDAPARRACRCGGAGFGARRLRFYGDPGLGRVERRLQLDVLHLRDVRVLAEDQRHRNVSLVQLVPEAGHAARPADTGPRHGEVRRGPLQHNFHRLRNERKCFSTLWSPDMKETRCPCVRLHRWLQSLWRQIGLLSEPIVLLKYTGTGF